MIWKEAPLFTLSNRKIMKILSLILKAESEIGPFSSEYKSIKYTYMYYITTIPNTGNRHGKP